MYSLLLPVLVFGPMAGGLACYLVGRGDRPLGDRPVRLLAAIIFAAALGLIPALAAGQELSIALPGFMGFGISFVLDGFRLLYGLIAAFMWLVTTFYSRDYFAHTSNRNRYDLFLFFTLGATLGVFFSADLLTTFLFFEVMSFTSYVLVAHEESAPALRAADTYLAVAIFGGLVMLMGLFLLWHHAGTLHISALHDACRKIDRPTLTLIGGLLLTGFGAKAGMFPLHIWLPKAHPVAPAPASALLSGVLTKSGVFGVLIISCEILRGDGAWGLTLLLLGAVTMLLGAVLALFSVDLKRILACSSVSQIGFILTGIGMQCLLGTHNALAVRGTLLHMANHSLIKLVLFLVAGVVYGNLHKLNLDDIRGFGRGKPLLAFVFLAGALSLAGVPFFSGYLSKTLLHESIVEYIWMFADYAFPARLIQGVEAVFVFSGGLTAAYMAKLFITLFVEKNPRRARPDAPSNPYMTRTTAACLTVPACILLVLGACPALMDKLADLGQGFMHSHAPEHAVHYYSWANLGGSFASLAIGAVVYCLIVRGVLTRREGAALCHPNRWPAWLDLEESLYRPLLRLLGWIFFRAMSLVDRLPGTLLRFLSWASAPVVSFLDRLPNGLFQTVLPAVGTFFARMADTLTDGLVRRLLRRFLRQREPRLFSEKQWGRYYEFLFPKKEKAREPYTITESFSFGLLLFAVGLCVLLSYVFLAALQYIR